MFKAGMLDRQRQSVLYMTAYQVIIAFCRQNARKNVSHVTGNLCIQRYTQFNVSFTNDNFRRYVTVRCVIAFIRQICLSQFGGANINR